MPTILSTILDQFLDVYRQEKKAFKNDRDAMIDLYLYFSAFMDELIETNKKQKNKYTKLKQTGLLYIKSNPKQILKNIK